MHYVLYYAPAEQGYLEIVKWLKEQGADINAKTADGYTPMHSAASEGNLEVVKWLKEQGANINAKSSKGETPLKYATERLKKCHQKTKVFLK